MTRPWQLGRVNVVAAVVIALAGYALFRLGVLAAHIVFTGFLGLLVGLNLSAACDVMERRGVRRSITAGGVVLLVFGALGGTAVLLAPTITQQARSIVKQLPQSIDKLDRQLQARGIRVPPPANDTVDDTVLAATAAPDTAARDTVVRDTAAASTSRTTATPPTSPDSATLGLRKQLVKQSRTLLSAAREVPAAAASALAGAFIVVFIAIFYAIEPAMYREGTLHLVPHRYRDRVRDTLSGTSIVLRRWLTAQLLAMLLIGALSTAAYLIIGVKAPLALGLIAGVFEFVPFVGPIAAAVPAIGMAAIDGGDKALYVALASLAIQQSEEVLIVPLLMKNNLEMPPILTILAQGAMGVTFGIVGLLVAVPMLAGIMVPIKMLYVHDVIGDEVDVDANGPIKRR